MTLPQHILKGLENGKMLKSKGYCGRFAPSPSGSLHLGNIRTALVSWLRARINNGRWLLRIDDLDYPRNRPGSVASIKKDLNWLDLNWDDEIIFQSQRKGFYYSVLSALKEQGKLYPCRCSRSTLLTRRKVFASTNFIYPGTCRKLHQCWGLENGRLPSWRLKVDHKFSSSCGDIVLRRSDGYIAYHLSTVIDELTLGVTEVVRGSDLAPAKYSQLAIFEALNQESLPYRHVPVLCNFDGKKLSKRENGIGINTLKEKGMNSRLIIGKLASSLRLIPEVTEISSHELLQYLKENKISLDKALED